MDLLFPLFFHTILDHTISSCIILNILKSPILTVKEVFTFIKTPDTHGVKGGKLHWYTELKP